MIMKSVSAHFDGEQVLFDEDITIPPNARLLVTIMEQSDGERTDFHQLASQAFADSYDETEVEYTEADLAP
ncbi:MAG: hypothetical protein ACQKBY_01335 [Verrucomicrobiales bacterium]